MKNECIFTHPAAYIGSLSGIVTVPSDSDKEKEALPVIVFLHGSSERGERALVSGLPAMINAGDVQISDAVTNSHHREEQSYRDAIPEFMRFNIVESEVRNVV